MIASVRNPNPVEQDFITAFENLRESLLSQLLENQERDSTVWKSYWELQALLHRLYTGQEKIIGANQYLGSNDLVS